MNKIKCTLLAIILIVVAACNNNQDTELLTGKEISLRLEPKQGNPRNSEGDFITLKDKRILFIYTHFTGGTGDNATAYLAGRYSSDSGITWTKEDEVILQNEGGMNIMSVSLLRLDNGDIALFYLRKNSESDCIPIMRTSSDEAKTWSELKECVSEPGYYVMNNDRVVKLKNKRIIFPLSLHKTPDTETTAIGKLICYYSDDNGINWTKSNEIENPENVTSQEPGIIELSDEKLMLFCRTESGVQYFSFSEDFGKSWSPIEPGNIKSPLSPASIERIPTTGDLLLVWNNNYKPERDGGKRTPFNLAISKDEGKSWQKIKTIESDPKGWYCYTAIEFTDNHVLLGHCAGDTRINNGLSTTQITRLSLDWIYSDATANPYIATDSNGIVKLACSDKNVEIRYTLDESLPSKTSGLLYQKPISIDRTSHLNMQAFAIGKAPSQLVSTNIGSDIYQQAQQLADEVKPGLIFHYYETEINFSDEIEQSSIIDSGIISQFSIEESRSTSNFAYIFDGFIKIPKDGLYTFYLKSNDGSVLYLNNQKLIDNDGAHGITEETVSTSLKAGMHKIKVKYFQLGGGKLLNVLWKGQGIDKQEISEKYLYH